MIQVKRLKRTVMAIGFSMALFSGGMAEAFDPYYLNGDDTFPMIQDTGKLRDDGRTGLFMDLSTLRIEDVFSDGLQVRTKVVDIRSSRKVKDDWLHVRYSVDGRSWALGKDKKWREIPGNTEDPSSLAVHYIREEMGKERDRFSNEISAILEKKNGNLRKTEPSQALPLAPSFKKKEKKENTFPDRNVKRKGNVKEAEKKDSSFPSDVKVTITEEPTVIITGDVPEQVDIS